MFGPVRAVIIDDIPSHLYAISSGFATAGIPCTPYWYDREQLNPRDKLNPTPPENGHEYLRVIFTDLNLDETTTSVAETINPVINIVQQLISPEGGPYAIIFWTGTSYTISEIRNELYLRLEKLEVNLPIAIDEIDKAPFLVSLDDEKLEEIDKAEDLPREDKIDKYLKVFFRKTFTKAENLKEEIFRVLGVYGLLLMVSEWESRAIHAAGSATNNLFNAAKSSITEDEDITESLSKVSALVACEAAGVSAAKENPARAYDAAMLDILVDSFNQSVNYGSYSDIVRNQIIGHIKNNIPINNPETVYAHLNTMFHLDLNAKGVGASNRGAVIELGIANKNDILFDVNSFCCWEDYFWQPRRDNVYVQLTTVDKELETSISRKLARKCKELIKHFKESITEVRQDRNQEINRLYEETKENKTKFADSIRWVLIEAGAECDHAQAKSRTLRYLVAAEVPAEFIDDYVYGGVNKRLKNDALKILGPYDIDGELFYLLVSLKRFVAWQPPAELPEIEVTYRLRKVIVDFLLNSYATWSMRPGITEFKP